MEPQVLFNDVTVSRFGIDFKKTTLVVEYSSEGSTFLRKIRFKRFRPDANPEKVTKKLIKQFDDILGPNKVDPAQLAELVNILLSKTATAKPQQAVLMKDKDEEEETIEHETFNDNDDEHDEDEAQKLISKDNYNKKESFATRMTPTASVFEDSLGAMMAGKTSPESNANKETNGNGKRKGKGKGAGGGDMVLDDLDDDFNDFQNDLDESLSLGEASSGSSEGEEENLEKGGELASSDFDLTNNAKGFQIGAKGDQGNQLNHSASASNSDPASVVVVEFGDLNVVSEAENYRAKSEMTKVFETKVLRPGDEGYEYDKQVDFETAESDNEWDEDD